LKGPFRSRNGLLRGVLVTLPLALLVNALSCSSSEHDRPGAFGGGSGSGSGSGASGGHGGHAGSGGSQGGMAGTSTAGSAGRAGSGGNEPRDAGHEGMDSATPKDAASDAGSAVNGCVQYVDRTSGGDVQTMPWDDDIGFTPERCMKVRVGQTVAFAGDFEEHPLAPYGGDTPSPIGEQTLFQQPGVFGYFCTTHPSMNGAIWVVQP
jgi:plastocyanin